MSVQEQLPSSQINIPFSSSNNLQNTNRGGTGFNELNGDNNIRDVRQFDTVLNVIFSSSQRECNQNLSENICLSSGKELPCFFEFLNSCSSKRDEDLVYGLYCLRHTNSTYRTYAAIGTQTTVNMQPIYLRPATCEKNMFLWSFLTKVPYQKAKEMISFMNISITESGNLAKFIEIVSEEYGSRQNSEEYQRLNQYLSAYCQHAIKCLESIPDRDKILIPIRMSEQFIEQNKMNKLVANITTRTDISRQQIGSKFKEYYVPLTMLNILDQINLLSFRIFCGIDRISLAPNVSITCERIYIGTGLSIRNAISNVDISKLRSHYPSNIYTLIRNIHGDNVHNNYDVLVLLALPNDTDTTINPQIFIAKRIFINSHFDIDKLNTITFC